MGTALKPFDQNMYGLSRERILRTCPSVYAEEATGVSDRYAFISTGGLIDVLAGIDFVPTEVMQARTRTPGKIGHTAHIVRFCRRDQLGYNQSEVFNLVLKNSHDGASAYRFYAGIFRLVCSNGAVMGDKFGAFSVTHRGNIVTEVREQSLLLAERAPAAMALVADMKRTALSKDERRLLAEFAIRLRYGSDETEEDVPEGTIVESIAPTTTLPMPFTPDEFLRIQRGADRGTDLWTTFNVVQEHTLRGGVSHYDRATGKKKSVRKVSSVSQTVNLNTMLWEFTERMFKIKNGLPIED